MAALRKQSLALRRGGCQVLHAVGETLVFVRLYQQEQVLVALQRAGSGAVTLPYTPLLAAGQWQRLEGKGEMEETQNAMTLQLGEESLTLWRRLG
jgi:alpha-glucosidase